MSITLPPRTRSALIESIQAFAADVHDAEWGIIAAERHLDYVLEEIGPAVYNRALRDIQARLESTVADLDIELRMIELAYSARQTGG